MLETKERILKYCTKFIIIRLIGVIGWSTMKFILMQKNEIYTIA